MAEGGVVGDFHGDSAMGFWGWPLASEQAAAQACRAALAIRREFAETADGAGKLANFRVGIGLASGRAVAGKIGTSDQVKVTVFGPVVNLAARLEGMTKLLRVPILLDEVTARHAREMLLPEEGRVRKLAKVRPEGMASAVSVSELLLSAEELPLISNVHLAHFEEAVEAAGARGLGAGDA
ncbi:MAG: adenylate/guanylate cyclase domain-containing protein [Pirellulales bacterium]